MWGQYQFEITRNLIKTLLSFTLQEGAPHEKIYLCLQNSIQMHTMNIWFSILSW